MLPKIVVTKLLESKNWLNDSSTQLKNLIKQQNQATKVRHSLIYSVFRHNENLCLWRSSLRSLSVFKHYGLHLNFWIFLNFYFQGFSLFLSIALYFLCYPCMLNIHFVLIFKFTASISFFNYMFYLLLSSFVNMSR